MPETPSPHLPTKIASLALPTREAHIVASVWPRPEGTLLFLAEINLAQPARQELTQNLTQSLEQAWSSTDHARGAEEVLEQVLLRINPTLKAHERLLGNPLAPRYHLCLGLLQGQALALAHLGHLSALVLNGQQATSIFGETKPRPSRASFEHLVSGNLEPGETLLLATASLLDYVSAEKLTRLFELHAPGLALREVEEVITTLEHHPPLGIIALHLGAVAEQNVGTNTSIQRLLATQDSTNSLLKPSTWHTLLEWARVRTKRSGPTTPKPTPAAQPQALPASRLYPRPHSGTMSRLTYWLSCLAATVGKLSWLRSRESAKAAVSWWLEGKLATWRAQPTTKRVFLSLALMVLVAFCQSIVTLGKGRLVAQDSEFYNQQVTTLTENQAAMESALIYRDEIKAQELLVTTKSLLGVLPRNTESREQQYQALSSSLTLVEHRLSRSTEIKNLKPWVNLPPLPPGKAWRTVTLVGKDVVATADNGEVVLVGTDGKLQSSLKLPADLSTPKRAVALDAAVLVIGQNGKQALVDVKTKSTQLIAAPLPLTDGSFYQGRLYYLSPKPPVIFRAAWSGAGFATPARWLRAAQGELPSARSLTVDGAIYVTDGTSVQKFVLGLKRNFTLQPATPPLEHIDTVRTAGDTDYLYLSSYADKRIVIYDKQGKLAAQLLFPTFQSVSDFTVDGPAKTIYLQSDGVIYQLKLSDYIRP